jgi:hypothetical protein
MVDDSEESPSAGFAMDRVGARRSDVSAENSNLWTSPDDAAQGKKPPRPVVGLCEGWISAPGSIGENIANFRVGRKHEMPCFMLFPNIPNGLGPLLRRGRAGLVHEGRIARRGYGGSTKCRGGDASSRYKLSNARPAKNPCRSIATALAGLVVDSAGPPPFDID